MAKRRNERDRRLDSIGGTRLGFGVHWRLTIAEVPRPYLQWMAGREFHGDVALKWMAREYLRLTGEGKQKRTWRRRDDHAAGKARGATGRPAGRQVVRRGKRGG